MRRTYQQGQSAKPQYQAANHSRRRPQPTWTKPIEQHHPEGHQRHDQSRHAGWECPLRQADSSVAHKQEQEAGNGRGAPLGACRPNPGLPAQQGIKNKSCGEVAGSGQQKRRKRFDPYRDSEVGRAPNDVDSRESRDEKDGVALLTASCDKDAEAGLFTD